MLWIHVILFFASCHKGFSQNTAICSSIPSMWGTCEKFKDCSMKLREQNLDEDDFMKNSKECGKQMICCHNPNTTELPSSPECGQPGFFQRIVGGETVELGELPWQAALGFSDGAPDTVSWRCGGALITRRHVLTAAHCFGGNAKLIKLRFGSTVLNGENEDGSSGVEIVPETIMIHENFKRETFRNDITMIILKEPVDFDERIRPVCLPFEKSIRQTNLEKLKHKKAVVSGFGDTLIENDTKVLRKVRLPIVKKKTCVKDFRKSVEYEVQPKFQLCAGYNKGKKDACYGDSGGPLILLMNNFYYLVGIVSEGFECALPKYPGIYTRVTAYADWIVAHL